METAYIYYNEGAVIMRYRSMVKMCGLISSKPHTDVVMVAASSPTGIVILWLYTSCVELSAFNNIM